MSDDSMYHNDKHRPAGSTCYCKCQSQALLTALLSVDAVSTASCLAARSRTTLHNALCQYSCTLLEVACTDLAAELICQQSLDILDYSRDLACASISKQLH
jgi:hypothetical protein